MLEVGWRRSFSRYRKANMRDGKSLYFASAKKNQIKFLRLMKLLKAMELRKEMLALQRRSGEVRDVSYVDLDFIIRGFLYENILVISNSPGRRRHASHFLHFILP